MISDILSEAIDAIEEYLNNPAFRDMYADPELRANIDSTLGTMRQTLAKLDVIPEGGDDEQQV